MHRIRTTFTRSRTPTGAEMKTQSSLEVPRQVRSTSFDEFQLESNRNASVEFFKHQTSADERSTLLQVPQMQHQQRSRSIESGGCIDSQTAVANYLEVPSGRRFQRRRSSGNKSPLSCVHCQCVDEYERNLAAVTAAAVATMVSDRSNNTISNETMSFSSTDSSSSDNDDDSIEYRKTDNLLTIPTPTSPCTIKFSLSPTDTDFPTFPLSSTTAAVAQSIPIDSQAASVPTPPPSKTSSTSSSYRQIVNSKDLSVVGDATDAVDTGDQSQSSSIDYDLPVFHIQPTRARRRSISRQEAIFIEPTGASLENVSDAADKCDGGDDVDIKSQFKDNEHFKSTKNDFVQDIFLKVPDADLKRDRAASVDSSFSKLSSNGKTEELNDSFALTVPSNAVRSRSVDIVLPTNEQERYKALALAGPAISKRHIEAAQKRQISQTPDWTENAVAGDHLWVPTSISGDFCYVGDNDCTKHGARMKCSACKIVAHVNCISIIMDRSQLACKPTFRDVGVRQYREQRTTHHHWIHRRTEKGKCKQCGKSIQAKLSFSSKEIVAISCAWCKSSYHNKESCFNSERISEECSLGTHANIVVPPSWIIKLPRRGSFKSSLRKTPRKKTATKKKSKEKEVKTFIIKPIPSTKVTPVLVFINPKSGGNQGTKLLQKFQWLLNPRQVFDLTQGGPKMGLELFRKVPQLRILACGGDGTAGWVLSVLDTMIFPSPPAVGVLPLGTGNDLARALGWGGGYTDEPIGKILSNIGNSDTVLLDRWSLKVSPNPNATSEKHDGKDNLPLNVVNNYFSFGVDAHIALEFHEAREAHPEKFNSRLRNKMFYGQAGGKDLLKRKWKDLADMVTLECDGKDLTSKLKEHRVHAIVFLNIPSYGGGTRPWNNSGGQYKASTDDGLIEVVGLTTYQLPLLQAGGHGTCITQCKTAKIVTSKTIPMQVDGEAAKLKPSIIEISLLNKALMLAKKKPGRTNIPLSSFEPINVEIYKISMSDYENHHYDKELLKTTANQFGNVKIDPMADLEQVRKLVEKYSEETSTCAKLSPDWCFLDSCTAERFFRIDRAQEHLHYYTDIASETMYLLDQELPTLPQTPEDESNLSPATLYGKKNPNFSSGSSDNLERESKENTPSSPSKSNKFFNRPSAGSSLNSDSGLDANSRKSGSQESQGSLSSPKRLQDDNSSFERMVNFKSNLLEKTSDAVIKAAKTGDFNLLRDLHVQGYSLLSIDATGQTALHYASKNGHKDIVKYLISYAPNSIINMVENTKGQTALHKAVENKHRNICYMLVAAGSNLNMRDVNGQTPMMLAFQADDNDLAAYLESQEKMLRSDYADNS